MRCGLRWGRASPSGRSTASVRMAEGPAMVLVEIFPSYYFHLVGFNPAKNAAADPAFMSAALAAYGGAGVRQHFSPRGGDADEADALISAAALRHFAGQPDCWSAARRRQRRLDLRRAGLKGADSERFRPDRRRGASGRCRAMRRDTMQSQHQRGMRVEKPKRRAVPAAPFRTRTPIRSMARKIETAPAARRKTPPPTSTA